MEPPGEYELKAFFTHVVNVLERLKIPYMVVGGFAAVFYGEPRLTLDVDIVVDMRPEHICPFVASFPILIFMSAKRASGILSPGVTLSMLFSPPLELKLIWSPCRATLSPRLLSTAGSG